MNLARALDIALPELPRLDDKERSFRFNPATIWRERTEKGVTHYMAIAPETRSVFMFTPERWKLVHLFNGARSYEEISRLWERQCGIYASVEAVRIFAENLDSKGFWLRTAEEQALVLMQEMKEREMKVKKHSFRELTKIYVAEVDRDKEITRAHDLFRFVFTTPFVLASIVALLWMLGLWIAHWDQVWSDSAAYWSTAGKTGWDILEFYVIFAFVGFCHESGHALAAKHTGAEVHRVGLMLVYTIPAFFVETTEVNVTGNYFQRMYVILAGFWFELMLCAVATLVWWGTPVGGPAHSFAYKVILVGGIMPVVFNMNPLMRLDGYLFFTKMIRQPFLKEKSTAFLSGWVQKHIFGLDTYVEPLRRRMALFYVAYAFLSGVYTYFVLLFLARLTYHVTSNFSPDWAFVPATLVALMIFRGRIEKFVGFLQALYQHHRDTMKSRRFQISVATAAVAVIIFACLPMWRETVSAPVMLEPKQRARVAAHVAGRVENVFVREGDNVVSGAPIATLSALDVEGEQSQAAGQLRQATDVATQARLRYGDFASADAERRRWEQSARIVADKNSRLSVASPIAGVVVGPHIQDLNGSYLTEGTKIADVEDVSWMRARVFVAEADMHHLMELHDVRIRLDARSSAITGTVEAISPTPQQPEAGVLDPNRYKGLLPPPQYVVSVLLPNDGSLRSGMTGAAKLSGRRQSLFGKLWRPLADFVGRKFW